MHWVDAHTHLDSDSLFPARAEVLQRAEDAGVRAMLVVNSEATQESFQRTLDCLSEVSPVKRYAAFGVHPHNASQYGKPLEDLLLGFLREKGTIALGEFGLDYYYDYSPRDSQVAALRRQLQLSRELNLPAVIHCRDAYLELAEILKSVAANWRGMIHCFTGTPGEAEKLLELGFHISFSGIITFRNADVLREAARIVPQDLILVETDAPYLAPVPYRGKTNEPAFVAHTGRFVAELKKIEVMEFARITTANFSRLFGLEIPAGD